MKRSGGGAGSRSARTGGRGVACRDRAAAGAGCGNRAGGRGDRGAARHLPGVPAAPARGRCSPTWRWRSPTGGRGDRDRGAARPGEPVRAGRLDADGVAAAGPRRRGAPAQGAGGAGRGAGTGVAGRGGPGPGAELRIDFDATVSIAHSEKQNAAATSKKTYGFHPLLAFLDRPEVASGEALAGLLRAGNAGSNTAADHVRVLGMALAQLPEPARPRPGDPGSPRVLARSDSAGPRTCSPPPAARKRWSSRRVPRR